jgi:hypothetical protein
MIMDNAVRVPGWTVITAASAPVAVLGAAAAGHLLCGQPYNPVCQTLSVLADFGRSAGVITCGFLFGALTQIATAWGMTVLPRSSRAILAAAGLCGVVLALVPQHSRGFGIRIAATATGAVLLAVWPLTTTPAELPAAGRQRVAVAASAVFWVLVSWVALETMGGDMLGLAERVCVFAETSWPLAVALSIRGWQGDPLVPGADRMMVLVAALRRSPIVWLGKPPLY